MTTRPHINCEHLPYARVIFDGGGYRAEVRCRCGKFTWTSEMGHPLFEDAERHARKLPLSAAKPRSRAKAARHEQEVRS